MKSKDVHIGQVYAVKVSGSIQPVMLTTVSNYGGWNGINVNTKRDIRIRTAAKLRFEMVKRADGHWVSKAVADAKPRCRECDNCKAVIAHKPEVQQALTGLSFSSESYAKIRGNWNVFVQAHPCTGN